MKKNFKIFAGLILLLSIAATSCKNSFLSKPSVQGGSISIVLPCSGRAADNDQIFNFEICFRYVTTKAETILKGKTGEKIIYENAQPGEYEIIAQVFNTAGKLCYEAEAKAVVTAGNTTPVTLELMRFLRLWTSNDDYATYIKKYMKEHPSDGLILEITQYDNAEQYQAELDAALKNNAPDAPDIFSVEDPVLLRYTQGDMESYTLPYESLGITQSQINDANFYDYVLQMGTGTDGKIRGLGYQSTAGAMIYNKAIAEELERAGAYDNAEGNTEEKLYNYLFVEGDDDPPIRQLLSLSDTLDELSHDDDKRYLVSCYDDLWKMYRAQEDQDHIFSQWIDEQNNLILNPLPYDFYNEYVSPPWERPIPCHNADPWSEEWFADMTNDEVFAFFGPAWFIKYFLRDVANVAPDQWGIIQSPVPFTWGGSFIMVNSNLPEVKKGVVKRIIEWMTLDTSTDGLMYKVAAEEDDTVASQVVMNRVISEGKGTSSTLGGADIYTIYDDAAKKVSAEYKTWYDSTLDEMFTREIRDSINMGRPREGTMLRFESQVYKQLGLKGDDIHDGPVVLSYGEGTLPDSNLYSLKAEPCDDGIKFTLTFAKNDTAEKTYYYAANFFGSYSSYYIRNTEDGVAMFLEDLLLENEQFFTVLTTGTTHTITCIYPVNIQKDEYYCFDLNYNALAPAGTNERDEYVTIPFIIKAGGGSQYISINEDYKTHITIDADNSDPENPYLIIKSTQDYPSYYSLKGGIASKFFDVKLSTQYNPDIFGETNISIGSNLSITQSVPSYCIDSLIEGQDHVSFHAEVALNLKLDGYEYLYFRMPPLNSEDYTVERMYDEQEYQYYAIVIDPSGQEMFRKEINGA